MSGFDGTGPRGLGPFTGGGRGLCVSGVSQAPVSTQTSTTRQIPTYAGILQGMVFGRGRGMGRGMGRKRGRRF